MCLVACVVQPCPPLTCLVLSLLVLACVLSYRGVSCLVWLSLVLSHVVVVLSCYLLSCLILLLSCLLVLLSCCCCLVLSCRVMPCLLLSCLLLSSLVFFCRDHLSTFCRPGLAQHSALHRVHPGSYLVVSCPV